MGGRAPPATWRLLVLLLLLAAPRLQALLQAIAGGWGHTCAITSSGVKCWGANLNGQLGRGDTEDRADGPDEMGSNLPAIDLGTNLTVQAVVAGDFHSCAMFVDGSIKCWGLNNYGQLGQGVTDTGDPQGIGNDPGEMGANLPWTNLGGAAAAAISAGDYFNCALLRSGVVKCWGDNRSGQLGIEDNAEHRGTDPGHMGINLPAVDLGRPSIAIAAGSLHACALLDDGGVKCWGGNGNGQLGLEHADSLGFAAGDMQKVVPVNLGTNRTAVAIAAGGGHTCAILDNGSVKCWGTNMNGVLGLDSADSDNIGDEPGEMGDNLQAVDLGTGRTAIAISAGALFNCVILDNGDVKCWGSNDLGQLGTENSHNVGDGGVFNVGGTSPVDLGTGRTAALVATGSQHTIALLDDGSIKCWGSNSNGQLGYGDMIHPRGKSANTMGDSLPAVNLDGDTIFFCPLGLFGEEDCEVCPAGTWALAGATQLSECIGCKPGESSALASTQCSVCPPGTYANSTASPECTPCGAGRYSNETGATSEDVCASCPTGTYSPDEIAATCQECEPGSYADEPSSAFCTLCPEGTFSGAVGATSETTCTPCAAGTFLPYKGANHSDECTLCPAGTYSTAVGATSSGTCSLCPAGTYSALEGADSDTTCAACPEGTYSTEEGASSSETCELCQAGRYSTEEGAANETTCALCPAGSYSAEVGASSINSCTLCPAGTFSPEPGATSNATCIPCVAGRYSTEDGADECTPCALGTYSNVTGATSSDTCQQCDAGSYADEMGSESCSLCPEGTYSDVVGATSEATCIPCDPGTYQPYKGANSSQDCLPCIAGRYSNATAATSADTCTQCPLGRYNPQPGAPDLGECVECEAGKYGDEHGLDACKPCVAGTYSTVEGATNETTCSLCPAGTYSTEEGAISPSNCTACAAGRFSSVEGASTPDTCTACPAGTYSAEEGASSNDTCTLCPVGTASPDEGATSNSTCTLCVPGRYAAVEGMDECTPCDLGTFSTEEGATSSGTCKPCDVGSFANVTGSDTCTLCPKGTYSEAVGATTEDTCLECPVGKYGDEPGLDACKSCVAGTYSTDAGATSSDTCSLCPAGTYSTEEGASSPTNCTACAAGRFSPIEGAWTNETCEPCQPGRYSAEEGATDETTCTLCPVGTYSSERAANSSSTCLPCGRGRYNPEPGASEEQQCLVCEAGKYGAQDVLAECTPCVAGRYSADEGAESESTCQHCAAGKYSEAESATSETTCNLCVAGKYSTVEGASSETTCTACALGKYSTVLAASSEAVCTPCDAGKYSTTPAASSETACIACAAGRFSDVLGAFTADTCEPCQTGRYSADEGATTCEFCEPGTFAGAEEQTKCEECGNGRYAKTGWSQCEVCPEGTYSVETDCIDCPSGLASPEGSTSPDQCQSLTTSFVTGAAILVCAIVLVLVYIVSGRAFTIAHREKESAISSVVRMCGTISSTLLSGLEWQQESASFWKMLAVVLLTVVLYVATLLLFLTNVFFLSRSFLVAPGWVDQFQAGIESLMQRIPVLAFLYIVPPVAKFFQFIDFTDLFVGVRVSCMGAQAPLVLAMNAIILIGTVVIIDSQLHTVLTLTLVPMLALMRDRLMAASNVGLLTRARNVVRFAVLVILSMTMTSLSRYVMQAFATVINYADFFPYHDWSQACNDDKADEALAYLTTVAAYGAAIPALFMIILVAMPGVPRGVKDQSRSAGTRPQVDSKATATTESKTRWERMLSLFNPVVWLLACMRLTLSRLYTHISDDIVTSRRSLALYEPDEMQQASAVASTAAGGQASAVSTTQADVPGVGDLRTSLRSGDWRQLGATLWTLLAIYAWKVKLALLLVFGVWTDELVETMQVDATARQHFDWVADPSRLHEDVMSVVGPMRSMVWMLVPVTIIFAKLSEVTNNPPVFVRSDKVTLLSPWLFRSWAEVEAVMLEGRELLKRLRSHHGGTPAPNSSSSARMQYNVQVALVWVLGARLPRFLINAIIFLLAVAVALNPTSDTLLVAAVLLFPWALVQALAIVSHVTLMLRLRKLLAHGGGDHNGGSKISAAAVAVEMRTMPREISDMNTRGDVL